MSTPNTDADNNDAASHQSFAATAAYLLHQQLTPFLPPPVVATIHVIDLKLEPYVGSDGGTLLLAASMLAAAVINFVVRKLVGTGASTTSASAIQQDDVLPAATVSFDETVLLCGPSGGGKTTILYRLLASSQKRNQFNIATVKSIQSNVAYWKPGSTNTTIRLLDAPGHWGCASTKWTATMSNYRTDRIVLVLDSTQSASAAAEFIHTFQQQHQRHQPLLIVGNKSRASKAKNIRRLKLQLRTELERLSKYGKATTADVEWDTYLNDTQRVGFLATSIMEEAIVGWDELVQYCQNGTMPASIGSSSRK